MYLSLSRIAITTVDSY